MPHAAGPGGPLVAIQGSLPPGAARGSADLTGAAPIAALLAARTLDRIAMRVAGQPFHRHHFHRLLPPVHCAPSSPPRRTSPTSPSLPLSSPLPPSLSPSSVFRRLIGTLPAVARPMRTRCAARRRRPYDPAAARTGPESVEGPARRRGRAAAAAAAVRGAGAGPAAGGRDRVHLQPQPDQAPPRHLQPHGRDRSRPSHPKPPSPPQADSD